MALCSLRWLTAYGPMLGAIANGMMLLFNVPEDSLTLSTAQLGDFINQGLGISDSSTSLLVSSDTASSPQSSPFASSFSTLSLSTRWLNSSTSHSKSEDAVTDSIASTTTTSILGSAPMTTSASLLSTSLNTTSASGSAASATQANASINVDACYSSWESYYAATYGFQSYQVSYDYYTTVPTTYTESFSGQPATTRTYTVSAFDETIATVDGAFTLGITTVHHSAVVGTETDAAIPPAVYTLTFDVGLESVFTLSTATLTTPDCPLPSVVPACQSSWESYVTSQLIASPLPPDHCDFYQGYIGRSPDDYTASPLACAASYRSQSSAWQSSIWAASRPRCNAVSITGDLCQSARDNWETVSNTFLWPSSGPNDLGDFYSHGSISTLGAPSWSWYTSSTLLGAPGCTMECGRCEIAGGTVQLIYWPNRATKTAASDRPLNSTIVQAPGTTGPATAVAMGTTFTSPTVYISYKGAHAQDACGNTYGTPIGATILAIPPDLTLSSLYGMRSGCVSLNPPDTFVDIYTAPFTFADLNEPVPYSIYTSQPICQVCPVSVLHPT